MLSCCILLPLLAFCSFYDVFSCYYSFSLLALLPNHAIVPFLLFLMSFSRHRQASFLIPSPSFDTLWDVSRRSPCDLKGSRPSTSKEERRFRALSCGRMPSRMRCAEGKRNVKENRKAIALNLSKH